VKKPLATLFLLVLAPHAFAQAPASGPAAGASTAPPNHTPLDLAHVATVAGPPRVAPLAGDALEAEAKRIAAVLRCPVCQGLSVGDSPSPMATNMRQQIRELVAAGFDEDQILSYFEASYGEFVRLKPPLRGVNWLVWLAPVLGLVLGIAVVGWVLRGATAAPPDESTAVSLEETTASGSASTSASAASPGPVLDPLPADPALAQAVLRVREMAYGWPGGLRPEGKA
jgi:cytochrome c-type biogenesis protein CcmH